MTTVPIQEVQAGKLVLLDGQAAAVVTKANGYVGVLFPGSGRVQMVNEDTAVLPCPRHSGGYTHPQGILITEMEVGDSSLQLVVSPTGKVLHLLATNGSFVSCDSAEEALVTWVCSKVAPDEPEAVKYVCRALGVLYGE